MTAPDQRSALLVDFGGVLTSYLFQGALLILGVGVGTLARRRAAA